MTVMSELFQAFLASHLIQLSVAVALASVIIAAAGKRFPHFTFMVCMLAFAKCLFPPLVTSPAGLFTRLPEFAFNPQSTPFSAEQLIQFKQTALLNNAAYPINSDLTNTAFFTPTASPFWFDYLSCLICIWVLGVVLLLGRSLWRFGQFHRQVMQSDYVPVRLQRLVSQLRDEASFNRSVRVVVSEQNFGPACLGVFRPTLIIPKAIAEWPDRLIKPVLAHELVHARRGDVFWGYIQFAAQVMWWFHPVVWWVGQKAHVLCERCCDEEVVARFRFPPGDYAESLVRVLELRKITQPIPLTSGMSPAQITSQRLERLMRRCGKYATGPSKMSCCVVFGIALTILPGMHWTSSQANTAESTNIDQRIRQLLQNGNVQRAIEELKEITSTNPDNASAVFYLGYALHMVGDLDEAIRYHRRATAYDNYRTLAYYNWACALALQDAPDRALEILTLAINSGFYDSQRLMSDPDLVSLHKDPRFKKLHEESKTRAELTKIRKYFSSWVGNWEVLDKAGNIVAENAITAHENGSVFREEWETVNGTYGTSVNYLAPESGKWMQDWIDESGRAIKLEGKFTDGKVHFEGVMVTVNGERLKSRMTFSPKSDGTVAQLIENSQDGGLTWREYFSGTYRRKDGSHVTSVYRPNPPTRNKIFQATISEVDATFLTPRRIPTRIQIQ